MNTVDALKKLYKTMAGKEWSYDPNPTDAEVIDKIADDTPEGGGGGGATVPENDVTLRDYDGSVIASYTADEFLALSAMPDAPTHDGLVAQGWNWSLEKAKAYVSKYGKLNVGQMYVTDDGKTRIYIQLQEERKSPKLGLGVNGTVDVDWGDGTPHDTLTGTSLSTPVKTPAHNYAHGGNYVIKLTVDGEAAITNINMPMCILLSGIDNPMDNGNTVYRNSIKRIEIGTNVTSIGYGAFGMCALLASISIPNNIRSIGDYAFSVCYSLSSIIIPDGVGSIGTQAFAFSTALSNIIMPDSVASIGTQAFDGCYALPSIILPDSVTSIGEKAFNSCGGLSRIAIPDSVTAINDLSFYGCRGLSSVIVSGSVASIGQKAFGGCSSIGKYHFKSTTPPTLASSDVFDAIASDCIIYVPYSADHSILEAYKTATNWSTHASKMREEEAA